LQQWYCVEGLDLDPGMLDIARERCPGVTFHQDDMVDFSLGRQFDVIVCLFSSIGYVRTVPNLRKSLAAMADHLRAGGVLFIEPWLSPAVYQAGSVHALFVDEPDLKIARMNVSDREGAISVLDFHYLVASSTDIAHFTERHELGLFSDAEYRSSVENAGLQVQYDDQGLMSRGLYIGVRPLS
jgi:SAM-dependent methyltransferase